MSICIALSLFEICEKPWPNEIIYGTRKIIDSIYANLSTKYPDKFSLEKETWRLTQWDGWNKNDGFYKVYNRNNIESWQNDMQEIKRDLLALWPTIRCKLGRQKFDIETHVGLHRAAEPSDADPNPLPTRNERVLCLLIPTDLFFKMDQETFAESIGEICHEFHITYALMDHWSNAHGSYLQDLFFEKFSAEKPIRGSQQIKLPTIAWWQYITPPIGTETGSIEMIREKCPTYKTHFYAANKASGLSIQLTETLQAASIYERLKLRDFFVKSLSSLSLKKIAPYWKNDEKEMFFEGLPLYDYELKELERITTSVKPIE